MGIKRKPLWLEISGKLTGEPNGIDGAVATYVYQKTSKVFGNVPDDRTGRCQIRRHVPQVNPRVPAQTIYRERFARGVASWHTLTNEDKEVWKQKGRKLQLNSFQAYMRWWCKTQPTNEPIQWDDGETIWDNGETIWME